MSEIIPGKLFLGDMDTSEHREWLEQNNISHILVVGAELEKHYTHRFKYHQIEIDDVQYADLLLHFHTCTKFIDEGHQSGGAVLVHCAAGISRSSTVVIAYLMEKNKWRYEYAMDQVRRFRPFISPNYGFRSQLKLFERANFLVDKSNPEIAKYIASLTGEEYENENDNEEM